MSNELSDQVAIVTGAGGGLGKQHALALARHVGADGKVIAIEPHPVTHARLAFNHAASGYGQVRLVQAACSSSGRSCVARNSSASPWSTSSGRRSCALAMRATVSWAAQALRSSPR